MKMIKLMVLLAFIMVGLINRHHAKPRHDVPVRVSTVEHADRTPVNKELLQNAERLTDTLRKCQQTAHSNNETK